MVSQSLLVMGATMSPSLAAILPPAGTFPSKKQDRIGLKFWMLISFCQTENIDKMLKDVITELQHYAHLAPSLKLALELIQEAEDRRRYFLRESGMRP